MKNVKYLLLLLIAFLVIPFSVFAEEEGEVVEASREVNVYIFRGEGCPHCQEAEEWFESIEEEYGEKFNIIDYETWYNEENALLMENVAQARGEDPEGVPYIIVGNKSWFGFMESYGTEILAEINSEYETAVEDRYDIMNLVDFSGTTTQAKEKESGNDVVALIIILVVVAGCGFGIYKARQSTK